jgi:ATP adenylyltransferase
MNLYPYANGHLMVAPYKHTPQFDDLTDSESLELLQSVSQSIRILKRSLKPEGFNVGLNLGKAAGAGVEDHIHFHIVPRWLGDSNFMPVLGEAKVIPEHIETTFRKLKRELQSEIGPKRVKMRKSPSASKKRRGDSG